MNKVNISGARETNHRKRGIGINNSKELRMERKKEDDNETSCFSVELTCNSINIHAEH
jgi:hypothetical protein